MLKTVVLMLNAAIWTAMFWSALHYHHDEPEALVLFAGFAIINWGAVLTGRNG